MYNNNTKRIKLKPCPFCKGRPIYRGSGKYGNSMVFEVANVRCEKCGARMTPLILYEGLDDIEKFNAAAERWNRRYDTLGFDAIHCVDTNLKSCPYCGKEAYFVSSAKVFHKNQCKGAEGELWVECRGCGVTPFDSEPYIIGDAESENAAKDRLRSKWNKREDNE